MSICCASSRGSYDPSVAGSSRNHMSENGGIIYLDLLMVPSISIYPYDPSVRLFIHTNHHDEIVVYTHDPTDGYIYIYIIDRANMR